MPMKKRTQYKFRNWLMWLVLASTLSSLSCAQMGLLSEQYGNPELLQASAPLPETLSQVNPRFLVYGDNRCGWRAAEVFARKENWTSKKMWLFPFYQLYLLGQGVWGGVDLLRHQTNYGIEEQRMVRDVLYEQAQTGTIDFIINTGDLIADGRYPTHWEHFLTVNKIEKPLIQEIPYVPVIGNHEHANDTEFGMPNFRAVFDYPQFFTLNFTDADLFVIDTDIIIDQYQDIPDDEQETLFTQWIVNNTGEGGPGWLENELASSDKRFKIVALHHPPLSFGKHHTNWTNPDYGPHLADKRAQFLDLLQKYGVQAVLCGHEHNYQHVALDYRADDGADRSIQFIITGGGGVPVRELKSPELIREFHQNYADAGINAQLILQKKAYHFCDVTVWPDVLRIDVLEVFEDRRTASFEQLLLDVDGNLIE